MITATTDNGARFYTEGGIRLPSVTTALSIRFPPPDDDAGRERWRILGERGTRIHELIARGTIDKATMDSLPDDVQRALFAWQRFTYGWQYHSAQREMALVSVELGYGGRCDDYGRIPQGAVIVDYKSGALREEYCRLQLGGYWGLFKATYPRRKLYGALAVQLGCKSGDFQVMSRGAREMDAAHIAFMEVLNEWKEATWTEKTPE